MRTMEFKVERPNLFEVGAELEVVETEMDNFLYYTLEHAYGMSGNIPFREALKTRKGKVIAIEERPQGLYATLEFEA
ncbi:MAG: hypothetical protein J6Z02_04110 [Lachnospiraceae bacterium]|nr:hypothetical protein [Lachnospiraceae bacterium]